MRYLLDTNVVSDLVRNPQGRVAEHIRRVGEARVCTSIIVAAELRYGATKKESRRLTAQLEAVLGALDVLPFQTPADAAYGLIRTRLEQAGRPIGGNDLLIAAQAIALGHTIVTDNEAEFARVDGLPRENWLRHSAGRRTARDAPNRR
jgi:tRNA(fMet)-specific endonuclease VapC